MVARSRRGAAPTVTDGYRQIACTLGTGRVGAGCGCGQSSCSPSRLAVCAEVRARECADGHRGMLYLPLLVLAHQQAVVLGSPKPDSSYVEVLTDRYTFATEAGAAAGAGGEAPAAPSAAPCSAPLSTPLPPREVFAFWSSKEPVVPASWQSLDWGRLTTVAVFHPWPPPPELVCHAHSRGVRVVSSDGTQWMHGANRSDPKVRAAWVSRHVSQMVASGTDGVNVDLEAYHGGLPGSVTPTPNSASPLLTSLLAELRSALWRKNRHAQLSMATQVCSSTPLCLLTAAHCLSPRYTADVADRVPGILLRGVQLHGYRERGGFFCGDGL